MLELAKKQENKLKMLCKQVSLQEVIITKLQNHISNALTETIDHKMKRLEAENELKHFK